MLLSFETVCGRSVNVLMKSLPHLTFYNYMISLNESILCFATNYCCLLPYFKKEIIGIIHLTFLFEKFLKIRA